MSGLRVMVVSVVGLACLACGDGVRTAVPLFTEADNVERSLSNVVFDTLWVVGGPEDTLLATPTWPRSDRSLGVVFFDLTNKKAYRIGSDGRVLWAWGQEGEGPGEIQNVRALDVRPDGAVVLMDSGNRRLVTLNEDGKQLDEVPLTSTGTVHSLAALSRGKVALHTSRPLFATWSTQDGVVEILPPAGLGEPTLIQHQGRVARWKDDYWVFGFGYGNGWLVFNGDKLMSVHPYVFHSDFPEVRFVRQGLRTFWHMPRRPPSSGRSVSTLGDTLFVLFGGPGPRRGRILDRYNLQTGEYIETDLLPHYANRAIVGEDGRIFTVNNSALYPSIVALARREPQEVVETISTTTQGSLQ